MAYTNLDHTFHRFVHGSGLADRNYGPVQLNAAQNANVAPALGSIYAYPFLSGQGGTFNLWEFYMANGGNPPDETDPIALVGIGLYANSDDGDLRPGALLATLAVLGLQASQAISGSMTYEMEPNTLYWIAYLPAQGTALGSTGDLTVVPINATSAYLDRATGSWLDDLPLSTIWNGVAYVSSVYLGYLYLSGFSNPENNVTVESSSTAGYTIAQSATRLIVQFADPQAETAAATVEIGDTGTPLVPSIVGQAIESAWALLGDGASVQSYPAIGWSAVQSFSGTLPDPFPTPTALHTSAGIPGIRLRQSALADQPSVESRYKSLASWRQKGATVERFYGAAVSAAQRPGSPGSFALDTAFAVPHYSGEGGVVDKIRCYVSNAGATTGLIRLAIYESRAPSNPIPGRLVVDSGELTASSIGFKTATISATLRPDRLYWLAIIADVDTTMRLQCENPDAFLPWLGDDGTLGNDRPLCAYSASYTYGPWPRIFPSGSFVAPTSAGSPVLPSVTIHYAS